MLDPRVRGIFLFEYSARRDCGDLFHISDKPTAVRFNHARAGSCFPDFRCVLGIRARAPARRRSIAYRADACGKCSLADGYRRLTSGIGTAVRNGRAPSRLALRLCENLSLDCLWIALGRPMPWHRRADVLSPAAWHRAANSAPRRLHCAHARASRLPTEWCDREAHGLQSGRCGRRHRRAGAE